MLLGQALRYVPTRLLPSCPHQAALVHAESDSSLNANRGRGFHVQGMAPGMVPSTTDDDPYLPHSRTAQELGRLVSRPWHCGIRRTPQFESISKNFLYLSCIHLSMYLQRQTFYLCSTNMMDFGWATFLQCCKMPGPLLRNTWTARLGHFWVLRH